MHRILFAQRRTVHDVKYDATLFNTIFDDEIWSQLRLCV